MWFYWKEKMESGVEWAMKWAKMENGRCGREEGRDLKRKWRSESFVVGRWNVFF